MKSLHIKKSTSSEKLFCIATAILISLFFSNSTYAANGAHRLPSPHFVVMEMAPATIYEGGTGNMIEFYFNSVPDDTVVIEVSPDSQLDCGAGVAENVFLTFYPDASALITQTIMVNAMNDDMAEGLHEGTVHIFDISGLGAASGAVDDYITIPIVDDDIAPAISVAASTGDILYEAHPLIYSEIHVSLTTIPTDAVSITAEPDSHLDIGNGPGIARTIDFGTDLSALSDIDLKVYPIDDAIYEGAYSGNIHFEVSSGDAVYESMTMADLSYEIEDNETEPLLNVVDPASLILTEGGSEENMTIALNSIPTDTVWITATPDDMMKITGAPGEAATLIFPPNSSAENMQNIPVKAYDDDIYEGTHAGTVSFSITTSDANYSAFSLPDLNFTIYDNDPVPAINYVASTMGTLHEGTADETSATIALNSIPSAIVTIIAIPDMYLKLKSGAGVADTLVFNNNSSAMTIKSIPISAADDFIYEGTHTGSVSFEVISDDPTYSAFTISTATFTIEDNDLMPAIELFGAAGLSGIEGDSTLEFSMALGSIPQKPVTIIANPDEELNLGKGKDSAVSLKFMDDSTAFNSQFIDMKLTDDHIVQGDHTGIITFSISSEDSYYASITIPDVSVTIFDNDATAIQTIHADDVQLYPTIGNGYIHLQLNNAAYLPALISVYAATGILVRASSINTTDKDLDLSSLPAGLYTIWIKGENISSVQKIEIMK